MSTSVCPICYNDEAPERPFIFLPCCNAGVCQCCLSRWFETCERTGQTMPTCPQCRQPVPPRESTKTLGRPFAPANNDNSSIPASDSTEVVVDDLTAQLLQETARPCGSCGAWIVKSTGCDLMQCLCGYRFCWQCGAPGGRECGCSPAHHHFWDNVLGPFASRSVVRVATPEQLQDLRHFLGTQRFFDRLRWELPKRSDTNTDMVLWKRVHLSLAAPAQREPACSRVDTELRHLRYFFQAKQLRERKWSEVHPRIRGHHQFTIDYSSRDRILWECVFQNYSLVPPPGRSTTAAEVELELLLTFLRARKAAFRSEMGNCLTQKSCRRTIAQEKTDQIVWDRLLRNHHRPAHPGSSFSAEDPRGRRHSFFLSSNNGANSSKNSTFRGLPPRNNVAAAGVRWSAEAAEIEHLREYQRTRRNMSRLIADIRRYYVQKRRRARCGAARRAFTFGRAHHQPPLDDEPTQFSS